MSLQLFTYWRKRQTLGWLHQCPSLGWTWGHNNWVSFLSLHTHTQTLHCGYLSLCPLNCRLEFIKFILHLSRLRWHRLYSSITIVSDKLFILFLFFILHILSFSIFLKQLNNIGNADNLDFYTIDSFTHICNHFAKLMIAITLLYFSQRTRISVFFVMHWRQRSKLIGFYFLISRTVPFFHLSHYWTEQLFKFYDIKPIILRNINHLIRERSSHRLFSSYFFSSQVFALMNRLAFITLSFFPNSWR